MIISGNLSSSYRIIITDRRKRDPTLQVPSHTTENNSLLRRGKDKPAHFQQLQTHRTIKKSFQKSVFLFSHMPKKQKQDEKTANESSNNL